MGKYKAEAVLAIVMDIIEDRDNIYSEPYVNGREIGWTISSGLRKVAFSENRNSDSIVVYCGMLGDFSMQGNVPCENVYRSSFMFPFDGYLQAATHIVKYL